jgi:2-polyprenyl-6-methoxyphenol hydroxylase-like FAD-dependent oxidoreductase
LSAKPELPVWESGGRVTLVGDAAHAMSPTAGIGAATALRSTATLAKVIKEEGISAESLRNYEDEMRSFAVPSIKGSFSWGKSLFGMKNFGDMVEVQA